MCVSVAEAQMHVFNTFVSSAKVFISSTKRVCSELSYHTKLGQLRFVFLFQFTKNNLHTRGHSTVIHQFLSYHTQVTVNCILGNVRDKGPPVRDTETIKAYW